MTAHDPSDPTRRHVLQTSAAVALVGCGDPGVGMKDDTGAVDDTAGVDPGDTSDPLGGGDTGEPVAPAEEISFDPGKVREDDRVFTWALQSGAITARTAILVTRVETNESLLVRVWRDSGNVGTVLLAFEDRVSAEDGGFVRVDVTGLAAGERHFYAFLITDSQGEVIARSAVGRFRAAPLANAMPKLTVALGACNGGNTGFDDAFGRVAEHDDVDLILHVGDLAYLDGARTLQEYRNAWGEWMESEGYKRALAHAGLFVTWDDHEVDNNWNPEEVSAQQQAAALQAFVEATTAVTDGDGNLWRSWRWGKTAEIFVLDCRSERLPSTIENQSNADDVYISPQQMAWLKDGLKNSEARFKIVMNSVPITFMPWFGVAADDRWEGYPGQRSELLGHIRDEDLENVWFVSGDFHINFVGKVNRSGQGRLAEQYEIAVTSGNSNPAALALQPPQFAYATASPRTVLMTLDPATDEVTVQFYDAGTGGQLDRELVLKQS